MYMSFIFFLISSFIRHFTTHTTTPRTRTRSCTRATTYHHCTHMVPLPACLLLPSFTHNTHTTPIPFPLLTLSKHVNKKNLPTTTHHHRTGCLPSHHLPGSPPPAHTCTTLLYLVCLPYVGPLLPAHLPHTHLHTPWFPLVTCPLPTCSLPLLRTQRFTKHAPCCTLYHTTTKCGWGGGLVGTHRTDRTDHALPPDGWWRNISTTSTPTHPSPPTDRDLPASPYLPPHHLPTPPPSPHCNTY